MIRRTSQTPNTDAMASLVGKILLIISKAGIYTSTVAKKNLRRFLVVFSVLEYTTGSIGLSSIYNLRIVIT
jgi:hypothetical protein